MSRRRIHEARGSGSTKRMKRFIEGEDRKQVTLLPECLDDFVAEDNPIRIIE